MKHLSSSILLVFSRNDSRLVFVATTLLFLFLVLLVQNGRDMMQVLSFDALPLFQRVTIATKTLLSVGDMSAFLLMVLGSSLGGMNMSLAYTYVRLRGELIMRSGLYGGFGLFLAFLGVGCAACGTAFISLLFGVVGFSSMLAALPYNGVEIGYVGIVFLSIATYSLSRKVSEPFVC